MGRVVARITSSGAVRLLGLMAGIPGMLLSPGAGASPHGVGWASQALG